MSADVLRKAAALMRHDVEFGQAHGDDAFLLAVADWLEHQAHYMEVRPKDYLGGHGARALAVARAYLGEQS